MVDRPQAEVGDLLKYFTQSFEDGRLSRSERQALRAVLDELDPSADQRLRLLGQVFGLARDALTRSADRGMLQWLEDSAKLLFDTRSLGQSQVCFSPQHDCAGRLCQLLDEASRSVCICVFTITDNTVSRAILRAHDRGVAVRIITDDEKMEAEGSDIIELAQEGVPVRMDDSPDHMHHKFALFDRRTLVTGSYNWTYSAASRNQENLVVTDDPRLVKDFLDEFDRLWTSFARVA
ncbi:MAG: phospholipase D-like domain-containing protein [Acidobacteriota bacterium]